MTFTGPSAAVKCQVAGDSGDVQYSIDGGAYAPANITVNGYQYVWAFPVAKNRTNASNTLTIKVTSGTARLINTEAAVSNVTLIMNNNTPTGSKQTAAAWQTDSDYSTDFNGAKALDGSTSTKWASTGGSPPHWLAVDLGSVKTVNGYILRNASTGGEPAYMNTKNFSFQTGDSMSGPWTDDAVVDNSAQAGVVTRSYITPKSVRYVRLYITNCGIDNYTRIPEYEVWGTAAASPTITLAPTSLSTSCTQGGDASSQSFTVDNTGGGTLSYSVSDNQTWLSVTPTSGTSTGEADTITVNYATSSLSAGTYNATITVTDPNATNNPQTIAVALTVNALEMNNNTPTGTNVAPQSTQVTTDSIYASGWEGTKAIDGVVSGSSKWCSNGNAPPHWLALDLGSSKIVNGYIVRMAGAAGEYTSCNFESFKLQTGSSISGPWTDDAVVSNTSQANVITRSYYTPKSVRYVRIYITDTGTDNYARLPEFEVYSPAAGPITVSEDFSSMPSWSSSFDASWGSAATWSIVGGGQSGNALQAARSSQGSSAKVRVYNITANTNYTISVYIKCPSFGSSYWAECGYRLGSSTAQNFDESGTWTMVKKFSFDGTNGNGNTWTQYSAAFNSGSNTQISVGFKLGSSGGGGPTVLWDTLRIQ